MLSAGTTDGQESPMELSFILVIRLRLHYRNITAHL